MRSWPGAAWSTTGPRRACAAKRPAPMADESAALTPYAASKIALQKAVAQFAREHQLSSAWGRIFFQFGPYEHPDRLVPSVIRHLLKNQEALCTHGRQIRSFLHVADVGAAFAQLLDSEVQGPVNIGSDERIALADLIGRIAREVGRPDLVRLGARSTSGDEPPLLVPDVQRLRDEVQWRPRLSLNEGISDAIAWWRGQLACRSLHEPPAELASAGGAFSHCARSLGDGAAAGGAIAAQRIPGGDRRDGGNLESVPGSGGGRVCLRRRALAPCWASTSAQRRV